MHTHPCVSQVQPSAWLGTWYSVLVVGTFAIGDLVGKGLPALPGLLPSSPQRSMWAVVVRAVVAVVVFAGALAVASPACMLLATLAFAVSNGYLSTALLLQGVSCVFMLCALPLTKGATGTHGLQAAEQEVASTVLIFALALGLAVGSVLSLVWLIA